MPKPQIHTIKIDRVNKARTRVHGNGAWWTVALPTEMRFRVGTTYRVEVEGMVILDLATDSARKIKAERRLDLAWAEIKRLEYLLERKGFDPVTGVPMVEPEPSYPAVAFMPYQDDSAAGVPERDPALADEPPAGYLDTYEDEARRYAQSYEPHRYGARCERDATGHKVQTYREDCRDERLRANQVNAVTGWRLTS